MIAKITRVELRKAICSHIEQMREGEEDDDQEMDERDNENNVTDVEGEARG